MMNIIRILMLAALGAIVSGCAGTPAQPAAAGQAVHTLAKQANSLAVVYVDPQVPLSVLRLDMGDGYGAIGMMIAASNRAAGQNGLEDRLTAHAQDLAKIDLVKRDYDLVRAALSASPRLQAAQWQRVQYDSDQSPRDLANMVGADTVVVISPVAMVYGNVSPLVLRCQIDIYAANHATSTSLPHRLEETTLEGVAPVGPDGADEVPSMMFHNQYLVKGPDLDERVNAMFADDSAQLRLAYTQAAAALQIQLSRYFTNPKLPLGRKQ